MKSHRSAVGTGVGSGASSPRPGLAYKSREFVDSDDARPMRILAEYLEPLQRLRDERVRDTIVFFGSARLTSEGAMGRFYDEARELARRITAWSKGLQPHPHRYLICSGGGGGIMEAASRGGLRTQGGVPLAST